MASLARLHEQGFIDLIARLSRRSRVRPIIGIGDDAASLALPPRTRTLFTTDLLTEGIHFRSGMTPGLLLGRKAMSVNLSDIAAMGGAPHACVISVGFPPRTRPAYAADVALGLAQQARRFGVAIVGGDTCASRSLTLSVALLGLVERGGAVRRDGARKGEGLFVSGHLGGSTAGLGLLRRGARLADGKRLTGLRLTPRLRRHAAAAVRRHLDPTPRVLFGRALGLTGLATSMIDLSDGLTPDLQRLCRASGAGAIVEEAAIPIDPAARALLEHRRAIEAALVGGEDYELLFTARMEHETLIARVARRLRLPVARIGEILPRRDGIRVLTRDGRYRPLPRGGFDHFRTSRPRH